MTEPLSANTKAILLLTAPLIAGHGGGSTDLLQPREYRALAGHLRSISKQPADLLSADAEYVLKDCDRIVDRARLERLLGRGFLMGQAVERWAARAIWVVSRADEGYPRKLKARLREESPPVLYGCGAMRSLEAGGLAVVGSRNADDASIEFARQIGCLTATAHRNIVSGGAKGIDRAAMRGALENQGTAVGVLADSLEKSSMSRENRSTLLEGKLVLVSPFDPGAGFNVGHAMRRNKIIYALADAALVVSADLNKGGTWAGATEQLDKLHLVPVYVRSGGDPGGALEALRKKGAIPWPNPADAEGFAATLATLERDSAHSRAQPELQIGETQPIAKQAGRAGIPHKIVDAPGTSANGSSSSPADELLAGVRKLILQILAQPRKTSEVATLLGVTKRQAEDWLNKLVEDGLLQRLNKPSRYAIREAELFKDQNSIEADSQANEESVLDDR